MNLMTKKSQMKKILKKIKKMMNKKTNKKMQKRIKKKIKMILIQETVQKLILKQQQRLNKQYIQNNLEWDKKIKKMIFLSLNLVKSINYNQQE